MFGKSFRSSLQIKWIKLVGVKNNAVDLFNSYLQNNDHCFYINKQSSEVKHVYVLRKTKHFGPMIDPNWYNNMFND